MIGEKIIALRESKGISQRQIARDTGLSRQTIRSMEANNSTTLENLNSVLNYLGAEIQIVTK